MLQRAMPFFTTGMMNLGTIPEFWVYGGALLALLALLVCRESFHAWRLQHDTANRVFHLFNICILLLLILATCYGIQRFEDHHDRFASLFLPYPTAHYKADRQSFEFKDEWIYVTDDTPETVIAFYEAQAAKGQYVLTVNKATSTSRLMFQKGDVQLFLTIVSDGDERMLYYGKDGSAKSIAY